MQSVVGTLSISVSGSLLSLGLNLTGSDKLQPLVLTHRNALSVNPHLPAEVWTKAQTRSSRLSAASGYSALTCLLQLQHFALPYGEWKCRKLRWYALYVSSETSAG